MCMTQGKKWILFWPVIYFFWTSYTSVDQYILESVLLVAMLLMMLIESVPKNSTANDCEQFTLNWMILYFQNSVPRYMMCFS